MNSLARACWFTAAIFAVLGMAFGIYMAAKGDHTLAPAHGHLNLLGWVTLGLYGAFYTLVPSVAESRLARLQVLLAVLGVLIIVPGIAMAVSGMGEGVAKVGSLVALLAALLFGVVVWRGTGRSVL